MLGRLDLSLTGPRMLIPVPTILEGEAFQVTARALTADLAASTPTSARYRIDDLNRGDAVLDWTSLTPATSMSFIVTTDQNAIRNGLSRERRQIIVEVSDSDGPIRRTLEYDIQDLQGII